MARRLQNDPRMKRARVTGLGMALAWTSWATCAAADDEPYDEPRVQAVERPFSVEAVMGAGTLVGEVGVLMGYTLHPRVSFVGGIGWGLEGAPQGGFGARLRPLTSQRTRKQHSMIAGLGLSMGRYEVRAVDRALGTVLGRLFDSMGHPGPCERPEDECDEQPPEPTDERTVAFARWVQLDAGYEFRKKGGFTLLVAGGLAWLTNANECENHGAPCEDTSPILFPTLTASVGHAF